MPLAPIVGKVRLFFPSLMDPLESEADYWLSLSCLTSHHHSSESVWYLTSRSRELQDAVVKNMEGSRLADPGVMVVYDVIASVWELLVDTPTGKSWSCFWLAQGFKKNSCGSLV
jgi:hypothetical protein